jgi:UDP-N-acetylglucosamine--N-acetylmuramyl-(pentapeptide) pyrophosphoryl-undecaprenol N-acetylglucosamine transferase
MRILISGGGTGGHIYPALAVAHELRARYGAELLFLGDVNGLETEIVPRAGIPFAGITAGKLRRYLSRSTLTDLGRIPVGVRQALRIVRDFAPDAAFTSGGYVSVPAGIAARRAGAPLLMHQQDVPPNLANQLLRPFATRISVSFPGSLRYFPARKTSLAGNPVRDEVLRVAGQPAGRFKTSFGFDPEQPVLLVTGGSQGAWHLNQVIATALPALLPRCQMVHVSGDKTYEQTKAIAEPTLLKRPEWRGRYVLMPYLTTRMPDALAAADLVLCRSGAATLAELAVLGKPSILVPLPPGFTGSPQAVNAQMFRGAGASDVLLDKDLTPESLQKVLLPLLENDARRMLMANATRSFAHPDAAAELADAVAGLAQRRAAKRARRTADAEAAPAGTGE